MRCEDYPSDFDSEDPRLYLLGIASSIELSHGENYDATRRLSGILFRLSNKPLSEVEGGIIDALSRVYWPDNSSKKEPERAERVLSQTRKLATRLSRFRRLKVEKQRNLIGLCNGLNPELLALCISSLHR